MASISTSGHFFQNASQPLHLQLDDCHFGDNIFESHRFFRHFIPVVPGNIPAPAPRDDDFMFCQCTSLERLSIKNAMFKPMTLLNSTEAIPLPQELLVNMARRHPTLRWLRSDLSAESVAMLQQERPDITFVSE